MCRDGVGGGARLSQGTGRSSDQILHAFGSHRFKRGDLSAAAAERAAPGLPRFTSFTLGSDPRPRQQRRAQIPLRTGPAVRSGAFCGRLADASPP